jgi:AcrR family transcriptional regulator
MPKLRPEAIEQRKDRIERAAKELFIAQGFHATSMRDIAAKAEVSLGNVYNYYRTKEELLESIITRYHGAIEARLREIFDEVEDPLSPASLERFGHRVKALVNDHYDYWLLMYIDVLEFQNQHFRRMFEGLSDRLRRRFAGSFADLRRSNALQDGVDPAVVFTAAYMQFFNYFLVEKLFGGNRHFGLSDDEVITSLAATFAQGALKPERLTRLAADTRT